MNIASFKAGSWRQAYQYQYFLPEKVDHEFVWSDPKLNELLERASLKLGELNAFSRLVPDVDIFIKMHVVKEAVVSSRIEGTKTEMDEVLLEEKEVDPERKDDWQEVNNYILAMDHAIEQLHRLPLSNRLLKETHAILMKNARGDNKSPGEFRTSQNWIGGASLADAVFIPPLHEEAKILMSDLEKFLHNSEISVPHLIKCAIAHYQFETIHPFLDGNGRLGRLLITLYLVGNRILDQPLLYLSDFFSKNKHLYYDNLMLVRQKNDLRQWLLFFLTGVIETSEKGIDVLQKIIRLKEKLTNEHIMQLGKKTKNANRLLLLLFSTPVVRISTVQEKLSVTAKTAGELINDFMKHGIVQEITGAQRNRLFVFNQYLSLFD